MAQRSQGGLRDAESLLDQLSLLPPPIEAAAVWDLLGAVPEQELLGLVDAMGSAEPVQLLEATRNLLDRGRDPGAVLQGLAGILRDLVLMAAAPERTELTGVSPQFRDQLPSLAKTIGRSRLLRWQADLRGSEQQLRQSVQPRLWLEVLLLGLLAEPVSPATIGVAAPAIPAESKATPVPSATPVPPAPPTPPTSPEAPITPAPTPELPPVAPAAAASNGEITNLPELWQQILGSLELPSTRMLLSQQAQLIRLDANRAVVQVASNWMGMVQSRAALLEQAVAKALGGNRQLILEAGKTAMPSPIAAPTPSPPRPSPAPPATPVAPTPTPPAPVAPTPAAPMASPSLPQAAPKPQSMTPTSGEQPAAPQPETPEQARGVERQAKNLADFFNGQVLDVDLTS